MEEPDYYFDLPNDSLTESSAPLWRRAAAFIIDLLVFNILFYSVFIQSFQSVSGITSDLLNIDYLLLKPGLIGLMFGVLAAASVVFCFYLVLSQYYFGRSFGQQLLGIHLSGRPNLWGLVIRNLLNSTFIVLLPFDLLGLLFTGRRFVDQSLGVNVLYKKRINLIEGFL